MKVVLASNNTGKIIELSEALKHLQIEFIPQSQLGVTDIPETGLSFVENALIKARHASSVTGLPVIADDSGLVVPKLQGAPGIYSARYAGEKASAKENIDKLLSALKDAQDKDRLAYFYCILVFMIRDEDPMPLVCDGIWSGTITNQVRGSGGFGYDPIFYDSSLQKTAAELPIEYKNKISHRGKALQLLKTKLPEKLHSEHIMLESWS